MFSNVWSENIALFERLIEIYSNAPKLYYGFKLVVMSADVCGRDDEGWYRYADKIVTNFVKHGALCEKSSCVKRVPPQSGNECCGRCVSPVVLVFKASSCSLDFLKPLYYSTMKRVTCLGVVLKLWTHQGLVRPGFCTVSLSNKGRGSFVIEQGFCLPCGASPGNGQSSEDL